MPKPELDALYRAGTADNWSPASDASRPDWDHAAQWVAASHPLGDVLDVGCFDGGFAARLAPGLQPFGIEMHAGAAQHASEHRGMTIVGDDFADLGAIDQKFSTTVAFDLIEHVHDPRAFLIILAGAVEPGGSVIVGTGNVDAPTWRFGRGRYWYSWYPEHITFISPRWCRRVALSVGLEVVRVQKIARNPSRRRFVVETLNNLAYLTLPRRLIGHLRKSPDDGPPAWAASRDHMLVQFRRLP